MRLTRDDVERLARPQAGVVTTAQLRAAGADTSWITRQVDGERWQRLHRGVLLTHSGTPSWRSRAWGAVLYAGDGAALSHASAAFIEEVRPTPPRMVDVSVPAHRRVMPTAGVVLHRRSPMPPTVGRPRRTWRGDTVLDLVASAASVDDAVGWLCDAVRSGTNTLEITQALDRRPGARRRTLLRELLADVAVGVESPLERRYHHDVERRHGLPQSRLQRREVVDGMWIRADAVYEGLGVRVELDGALAHSRGRTDADTWRDNAVVVVVGDVTLRYRWVHVALTPCRTAAQVHAALTARGLTEPLRRCGAACSIP